MTKIYYFVSPHSYTGCGLTEGGEGEEVGQTHALLVSKRLKLGQHGLGEIDCRAACVINQTQSTVCVCLFLTIEYYSALMRYR